MHSCEIDNFIYFYLVFRLLFSNTSYFAFNIMTPMIWIVKNNDSCRNLCKIYGWQHISICVSIVTECSLHMYLKTNRHIAQYSFDFLKISMNEMR